MSVDQRDHDETHNGTYSVTSRMLRGTALRHGLRAHTKNELTPKSLETFRGRARQTLCKVSLQEPQIPLTLLNYAFDLVDASLLLPRDVVPAFPKFHLKNNEFAPEPALYFCRFCYFVYE